MHGDRTLDHINHDIEVQEPELTKCEDDLYNNFAVYAEIYVRDVMSKSLSPQETNLGLKRTYVAFSKNDDDLRNAYDAPAFSMRTLHTERDKHMQKTDELIWSMEDASDQLEKL